MIGFVGRRVLVVEDEALIAMDIVAILEELGVLVRGPATTLAAAVRAAAEFDVDIALLDVNLARQQVWPAAEVLRRRCVPMIFMTGYASFKFPSQFAECARLEKPVLPERLTAALECVLRDLR